MAETTDEALKPHAATRWWQIFLVYPTLLASMGAAVPTVWNELKAWRLGIRSSQLQLAEEQRRLWEKNLECLTHQGVWENDGPGEVTVAVTICDTGDLLVRYKVKGEETTYVWVRLPPPDKLKPYAGR